MGAIDDMLAMGLPKARCEKALHVTGNNGAEAATGDLEDVFLCCFIDPQ